MNSTISKRTRKTSNIKSKQLVDSKKLNNSKKSSTTQTTTTTNNNNIQRLKRRQSMVDQSIDHINLYQLGQEALVLTACCATVLIVVGLFFFRHLFATLSHMFITLLLMAVILASSSTAIALVAIKFAVRFNMNPDNALIPIVCALMDIIASYSLFAIVSGRSSTGGFE